MKNNNKFDYKKYKDQLAKIKNSWLCKTPIAHRGLHNNDNAPENSINAFKNAVKKNYAIELDVHQLKDGNLAVFHDNSLIRMCGKPVMISSLTTEELKNYNLANSDQKIPTLDEVLSVVDGKVPLLIELKSFKLNGKIESALLEKMKNYNGQYAIESFNPYSLNWFKKNAPEVIRGQLISNMGNAVGYGIGDTIMHMLVNSKKTMPHFISSSISAISKIKNGEKPLISWTVKTKEQYDKVMQYCDNAIFEKFNPLKLLTQHHLNIA